ncbi:MAG TPA: hypothetical protein VNG33_09825 [Polyangiaceae bacterium]|nr:hypothetical protein [Polyangiaceae bacterium]
MNRRKIAALNGAFICLLAVAAAGVALAAPDPRSQARAILAELAKKPDAQRVASESIAKAEDALRRADQLRAAGDQKRGAMQEEAALEWATAADLVDKTAQAEKKLAELQTRTTELETKVFRAQALVEQSVARRARAEEAVRNLDAKGAKP